LLIGKKVTTIPHKELHDDYFDLDGIIVNYKEEEEIKRNSKHNNNPEPTGKIIPMYQIEFTQLPHKEMSKKLWVFGDMFTTQ